MALTHKAGRRAARLAMKADPFPASMLEAARETLVIRPALLVAVARAH
ncbi:hypothetical protein K8I61_19080 [bacterium]|nr:hypothetical protein [bacterium]